MSSQVRENLYRIVQAWEDQDRQDCRDRYPFWTVLEELFFHADLRFRDYKQYQDEGAFPVRLQNWLNNVSADRDRRALFKLLPWIVFIDQQQMLSLYRDAFRRIIVPWLISESFSADDTLDPAYRSKLIDAMRKYSLHSITESFAFPTFLQINDLLGLAKPRSFEEDVRQVQTILPDANSAACRGVIVFEDFVGTGKQAADILAAISRHSPTTWRILFVPLLIMEVGVSKLRRDRRLSGIEIRPVMTIPRSACLCSVPAAGEPPEFPRVRAVIQSTATRVLRRLNNHDDPPTSAFGYNNSGGLLVTCHNTPNNTLAMLHHRAPEWSPLFRRLHHTKEGLK